MLEACVGETLAALEAREAATWARDPAVASVLEQIAADELRHAELGWRTLRWILDQKDASLRAFALERLESAICEAGAASADEGVPPALRAHGLLDDELRDTLRRRALESSIAPCVAALRQHFGLGSAHQVVKVRLWFLDLELADPSRAVDNPGAEWHGRAGDRR